jgi:hypothetical protein
LHRSGAARLIVGLDHRAVGLCRIRALDARSYRPLPNILRCWFTFVRASATIRAW